MKYGIHSIPVKISLHASRRIAEWVNNTIDPGEKIYFVRRLIKEGKIVKNIQKNGEVGIIKKGRFRAKFTVKAGVLWILTIEEE
ncbi:MAG: hypothetical protein ACE5J5_07295 [Candidatus Hydrothermarchaeales archaeon]